MYNIGVYPQYPARTSGLKQRSLVISRNWSGIAKAIKFLPKLQKCLALQAAEARAAGEPDLDHDLDFGSDDD
jgi:hypothetical protein